MGWGWSFGFMPYGARWREHRRHFHQYFSSSVIENYVGIAERHRTEFLNALLEQPEDFRSFIRL